MSLESQVIDSSLGFFPMQTGNRWIYDYRALYMTNGHMYYYSVDVLNDTLMPNGKTYRKFLTKKWNDGSITLALYRMDSASANVYAIFDGVTEIRIDSLKRPSQLDTVLGVPTKTISTGVVGGGRWLTFGFGLTRTTEEPGGFPYGSYIVYANINGTGYGTLLDVLNGPKLPRSIELFANYPNPFNPTTTISFSLARSAFIELGVFNINGQEIATLKRSKLSPGSYSMTFDGSLLPSGAYFYRLSSDGALLTKRMLLLK